MKRGQGILHITPHLGGGVGRVLLNYLAAAVGRPPAQRIICLDYANPGARGRAETLGIPLADRLGRDRSALFQALAEAEAVVIHWWNHPLLQSFLSAGPWPPARVLLWSHVSGLSAPQLITTALASFPDILAVASPVSFRAPALTALTEGDRAARLRLLFSSGGFAQVEDLPPERGRSGRPFRVGYLGTVDYAKMHPAFIDLCLSADLPPETVFAVAGGPEQAALRAAVQARGLADRFEILGPIEDVAGFLASVDIFGYPLNPEHYGTGEQALIEALAAGVPPVVLGGGAEEFVVEDGLTGLTAPGPAEYGPALKRLYGDEELRRRLGAAARIRARERFGLDRTVAVFSALYEELFTRPKRPRLWPGWEPNQPPWRIFLESQGPAAGPFYEKLEAPQPAEPLNISALTRAAFSATRGSVFHYADFFPEDRRLRRWAELLRHLHP